MSRRRGSATALNASDVVAALAMFLIYSHISMCQDLFLLIFPPHFYFYCSAIKMSFQQAQGRLLRKKRAEMRHTAPVEKSTALRLRSLRPDTPGPPDSRGRLSPHGSCPRRLLWIRERECQNAPAARCPGCLSLGSGRPVFLRSSAKMVHLAGRELHL